MLVASVNIELSNLLSEPPSTSHLSEEIQNMKFSPTEDRNFKAAVSNEDCDKLGVEGGGEGYLLYLLGIKRNGFPTT